MKALIACAVLAASVALAVPANAAILIGATRIEIMNGFAPAPNNNLGYIQVGEVLALTPTSVDVAAASAGATASATSPYFTMVMQSDQYSIYDGPGKAIDGLYPAGYYDPNYAQYPGPYGIYHSAGNDGSDVLTINFAGPSNLAELTIFGRSDKNGVSARDLYKVKIFNADGLALYSGTLDARTDGFATVSFVPEPATWTMLFLGFGAIGWTLRSQRRQQGSIATA